MEYTFTSDNFEEEVLKSDVPVLVDMFKTDNKDLFDFSLEQVEEAGWILENHTYDLHHSEYNEGNVMTEYEEKFSAKGNPICRLVAYRHAK